MSITMHHLVKPLITVVFTALLLLFFCGSSLCAQSSVSGIVKSVNGDPIPKVQVEVSSQVTSDLFSAPDTRLSDRQNRYEINFDEPGLYEIKVYGVFHRTVSIPILIFDQEPISMDIYLIPAPFNSGNYFNKQVYTNWIRTYGNFNNYDFFSGEIFSMNNDGSISAYIKTELDTIRYQVRGISDESRVLPKADFYNFRENRTFEAALLNNDKEDSVEIRYHPEEDISYTKFIPEKLRSSQFALDAVLSFEKPEDFLWIEPLRLVRSNTRTFVQNPNENRSKPDSAQLAERIKQSFQSWPSSFSVSEEKDWIKKVLDKNGLHPQQRSALYIAYAGLLHQETTLNTIAENFSEDTPDQKSVPDPEFLYEIIENTQPAHPLWAMRSEAALNLLKLSDYDPAFVRYAEQMIRHHPDEMVVRHLSLDLIEKNADSYADINEMPTYNWIVSRYGENNLARKAHLAFQQSKNK